MSGDRLLRIVEFCARIAVSAEKAARLATDGELDSISDALDEIEAGVTNIQTHVEEAKRAGATK